MFVLNLDWGQIKRMNTWVTFASIYSLFYCWGVTEGVLTHRPMSPLQYTQTAMNGVGILAVWGLGIRIRVIREMFWRTFIVVDVVIYFVNLIMLGASRSHPPLLWVVVVTVAIYVPYYSGMYIYAFRSRIIWQPVRRVKTEN